MEEHGATTTPPQLSDANAKRRPLIDPRRSWAPIGLIILAVLIMLYLGWVFLDRAASRSQPLSNLEQTFFGVYTMFVGAAISWMTTHVYAKREVRERFEQLARPALRRVVAARESAEGLLLAVNRRQAECSKEDEELFASLREIIDQHARNLDDAIVDWHELLPEEAARALLQSDASTRGRIADQFKSVTERLAAIEENQEAKEPPSPDVLVLRREVERLRKDLDRSTVYSGSFQLPVSALTPGSNAISALGADFRQGAILRSTGKADDK